MTSKTATIFIVLVLGFIGLGAWTWSGWKETSSLAKKESRLASAIAVLPPDHGQVQGSSSLVAPAPLASGGTPSSKMNGVPSSGLPQFSAEPQPPAKANPAQRSDTSSSSPKRATSPRRPAEILLGKDLTNPMERAAAVSQMAEAENLRYRDVVERAALLGIPLRREGPGHKVSILHDIRGTEPLYRTTLNANAAISGAADLIRETAPYNLDGSGIRAGVWDAGSVRDTHQEFGTRVTKMNPSSGNDDHATHVAGTMGAAGVQPAAKGMAPQVTINSYDWNSDYSEMTAEGAASAGDTRRMVISNHSYGYDATTSDMGRYEIECRDTDSLTSSLPYYLVFWAAGNEQDLLTDKGGYQSITFNGLAKNIVSVGACDDAVAGGKRSLSNANIASYSSWGPCDDGRIKPDLVANGVDVYSCVATGNTSYEGDYSGTSMAAPAVAGSAALLQQLYRKNFSGQLMRASLLKALLIHTADDLGAPGPDYRSGWGLINAEAAAELILDDYNNQGSLKMQEETVTNSQTRVVHRFEWDGLGPIKATLCWTDPAGAVETAADSRDPNLVHNLDLRITAPDGSISQPFVMPYVGAWSNALLSAPAIRGQNDVDNVEQVYLTDPPANGTYEVIVSLTGQLTTPAQDYSLIITGGTDVEANPPPAVSLTSPSGDLLVSPGESVSLAATATDETLGGAPGLVAQVDFLANGVVIQSDLDAPYAFVWFPAEGTYSVVARATDTEGAVSTSSPAVVEVRNQSPTISSAQLSTPLGAYVDAPVFASVVLATDPEGSVLTFSYQWQFSLNGEMWTNSEGLTASTLSPSPDHGAKLWRCRIEASDGLLLSPSFFTASISLGQRPLTEAVVGAEYSFQPAIYVPSVSNVFQRPLIINEFSQGSNSAGEWIELLMLKQGSLAYFDLRDSSNNYLLFLDDPIWDDLPAGTLLVIYNGEDAKDPILPADDDNPLDDGKMVISSANPAFFDMETLWPRWGNRGDSIFINDVDSVTVAEVAYGNSSAATPNVGTVSRQRAAYYQGNTEEGPTTAESWYTTTASLVRVFPQDADSVDGVTPGEGNNGPNRDFVTNLSSGIFGEENFYRLGEGNQMPPGLSLEASTGLLSGIPGETGTYNIVLECYNALGQSATQSYQLSIASPSVGFSTWISEYPAVEDTSLAGDSEGDGYSNLMEYFMALDPTVADSAGLSGMVLIEEDSLQMVYRRSKTASEVTGVVQWKTNLISVDPWSDAGVVDTLLSDRPDHQLRQATVPIKAGEGSKFLQLKVDSP